MKTVCIKIGGSTVDATGLLQELGQSIAKLLPATFPIIVHGGGKDIARMLDKLDKEYSFVEGMRVTDAEMVSIVQMVLSGDVNKRIVNLLLKEGVIAAGISGVDGNLFEVSKMLMRGHDIGLVGKIEKVNTAVIDAFKPCKIVPVISPLSRDKTGTIYNVNADLAASELAMAIKADDLIFVSDVPGVLIDDVVQKEIRTGEIEGLISRGHVTGGMIPKLRSAADAVHRGVKRVHICGWRDSATLQQQLLKDTATGTVIFK
ncbi:MAG: acetylglutamate kinase [Chitinispirillaceae bacterium]|nr:acetylglutamate kinase [Chitinispirillaceae bacterium]